MKIAQVAPLYESVPPKLYGGTERIVSYLTEALVSRGHEVTLFASGDSSTTAELIAPAQRAMRLDPDIRDAVPYHVIMLEEIRSRAETFDMIHFHTDLLQFPLARTLPGRTVTTLHGRLDLPDLQPFYKAFPDIPLVSISDDQRRPMPPVNWVGTVHHGLPETLLPYRPQASGYLAFLGRVSPEKRPDLAIEIAERSGLPLKIAAKIDNADKEYWTNVIEPLLSRSPMVEFIGEINDSQKASFLGDAAALLFPIDWPEPFGIVMIEAMSCGTPVIAFGRGSVPEVIENGVNGYIVDTVDEAIDAARRVHTLSRLRTRRSFEQRFTATRMAHDYEGIYRQVQAAAVQTVPSKRAGPSAISAVA